MSFFAKIGKFNNKVAIITQSNLKVSYKKLIFLSKNSIKKIEHRSLIFLLGGNNLETIIYYVGLVNSKSVVTILDKNINYNFLKNLISNYKPNFVILPTSHLNISGYTIYETFLEYKILIQKKYKKMPMYDKLAILLNTSGSTGSLKLVRQSYENYFVNSKAIIEKIKLSKKDSVITTLPISYTFGLSIINTYLISGAKIILNEYPILQKNFWNVYSQHKPTGFYGVPFMYEMISRLNLEKLTSKNLKIICQAGGKLNYDLFKKVAIFAKKRKLNFYSMYGQTEATARMSILDPKYNLKKIGSIGKPLPGGEFYLVNEKNKKINFPNKTGELVYEGKNACLGYSESYLDLKLKNENNYKIFTGDIATFDKDGFYYIKGRKKRFIKILGIRVNLDEVETIIENLGYEAYCKIQDELLIIMITSSKVDINHLIKKLSFILKINKSLLKIKKIKKIKRNYFGKKMYV